MDIWVVFSLLMSPKTPGEFDGEWGATTCVVNTTQKFFSVLLLARCSSPQLCLQWRMICTQVYLPCIYVYIREISRGGIWMIEHSFAESTRPASWLFFSFLFPLLMKSVVHISSQEGAVASRGLPSKEIELG